jgi:flagellar biogenesis protein FliO
MTVFVRHGLAALLLVLHVGMALSAESLADGSAAANAPATPIPYKREEASPASDLARLIAALGVCGLVLAGILYTLKHRQRVQGKASSPRRHIELLETQRIAPRTSLHAVRFANTVYLIAHSEHGITTVASAEEVNSGTGKESA